MGGGHTASVDGGVTLLTWMGGHTASMDGGGHTASMDGGGHTANMDGGGHTASTNGGGHTANMDGLSEMRMALCPSCSGECREAGEPDETLLGTWPSTPSCLLTRVQYCALSIVLVA